MSIRIERQTLYAQVWATPLGRLAKSYGISDVALTRVCTRLKVPRPRRGHWARVAAGYAPKQLSLPRLNKGRPEFVELSPRPQTSPRSRPDVLDAPAPKTLSKAHPLVADARRALSMAKPGEDGLLKSSSVIVLTVEVSKAQLGRALRTLDTLIKALEARGHAAHVNTSPAPYRGTEWTPTLLTVGGVKFHLRLRERLKRGDNDEWTGPRDLLHRRYLFSPSGKLDLSVHATGDVFVSRRWSDGKKRRLDAIVGRVILDLEAASAAATKQSQQRDTEARSREARADAAEERERLRAYEGALGRDLENLASRFSRAGEVRRFLAAFRDRFGVAETDGGVATWLRWAEAQADALDPLTDIEGVAKTLTPAEDWQPKG